VFLVNSRFPLLSAATTSSPSIVGSPAVAPLLPRLRGQFAEFLNHSSPDRLGIFYLTTCVGLGYGPRTTSLEAFLGSIGSLTSPDTARRHVSPLGCRADLPTRRATRLPQDNHRLGSATFLRHPITHLHTTKAPTRTPSARKPRMFGMVSVVVIGVGVVLRVREYQPVIHRLRLSASP
jgi:hypothetical protein